MVAPPLDTIPATVAVSDSIPADRHHPAFMLVTPRSSEPLLGAFFRHGTGIYQMDSTSVGFRRVCAVDEVTDATLMIAVPAHTLEPMRELFEDLDTSVLPVARYESVIARFLDTADGRTP